MIIIIIIIIIKICSAHISTLLGAQGAETEKNMKSDTFGQEIKIELVIDNEGKYLQLYNDSFLFNWTCKSGIT